MKLTKLLSILIMTVLCAVLLTGQAFAAEEGAEGGGETEEATAVSYVSVSDEIYKWIDENIDTDAMGLNDPDTAEDEGPATFWMIFSIVAAAVGVLFLILGFNSWKILLRIACFLAGFVGGFIGYSMLFTYLLNTTDDMNVVGLCRFFLGSPLAQSIFAIVVALICLALTRFVFRVALFGGTVAACVIIPPMFIELPIPVLIVVGAVLGYFVAFPLAKPLLSVVLAALSGTLISFAVIELFLYGVVMASYEPFDVLDSYEAETLDMLFLIIAGAVALLVLIVRLIVFIVSYLKRRKRNKLIMGAALEDARTLRAIRAASPFEAPLPLEGRALKARVKEQEIANREQERAARAAAAERQRCKKEEQETKKLRRLLAMAEKKYAKKNPGEVVAAYPVATAVAVPAEPITEAPVIAEPIEEEVIHFEEVPGEVAEVYEVAEFVEEAPVVEEAVVEEPVPEEMPEVVAMVEETVVEEPVPAPIEEEPAPVEEEPAPEEEPEPTPVKEVKKNVNAPKKLKVSKDCSDCSKCDLRPYCKSPKAKVCKPSYCATCAARKICPKPLA